MFCLYIPQKQAANDKQTQIELAYIYTRMWFCNPENMFTSFQVLWHDLHIHLRTGRRTKQTCFGYHHPHRKFVNNLWVFNIRPTHSAGTQLADSRYNADNNTMICTHRIVVVVGYMCVRNQTPHDKGILFD